MVLVDSSVWIIARTLVRVHELAGEDEIVTCLPVMEEVLRGARSDDDWRDALDQFEKMTILEASMTFAVFEHAAHVYRSGRKIGITIRSPYDCLIAACALRNDAEVLHADRDFEQIARYMPLKQRNL